MLSFHFVRADLEEPGPEQRTTLAGGGWQGHGAPQVEAHPGSGVQEREVHVAWGLGALDLFFLGRGTQALCLPLLAFF